MLNSTETSSETPCCTRAHVPYLSKACTLNVMSQLVKEEMQTVSMSCGECHNPAANRRCIQCKSIVYCNKQCQRAAWKAGHRDECNSEEHARSFIGVVHMTNPLPTYDLITNKKYMKQIGEQLCTPALYVFHPFATVDQMMTVLGVDPENMFQLSLDLPITDKGEVSVNTYLCDYLSPCRTVCIGTVSCGKGRHFESEIALPNAPTFRSD